MAAPIEPGVAFRSGTPRVVFKTELVGPVDVGRDGRWLMIEPEEQEVITELSIIVNWFEELKRLDIGRTLVDVSGRPRKLLT